MRRKFSFNMSKSLTLALSIAPAGLLPAAAHAQEAQADHKYVSPWRTPWTYEGARGDDHWADLDPQYAACRGKEQSPIDIRETHKANLPALRFDYKSGPIPYVTNNGATIRVNYEAPGSGDFLIVGDARYQLTQFHFHRPSEETIYGKHFEMEVHLVHADATGHLAVVAILLKRGTDNPLIHELWNDLPPKKEEEEDRKSVV